MPRGINEIEPVSALLQRLAVVLPANTQFAADGGTVLVNNDDPVFMYGQYTSGVQTGALTFPVLLIQEDGDTAARTYYQQWKLNDLVVFATLIYPYQAQAQTMNTIWTTWGLDLRRMRSNVQDSPRLKDANGVQYAERAYNLKISGRRDGSVDNDTYGFSVLKRWLELHFDLAVYTSVG